MDVSSYTGFDCSLYTCPYGDDPEVAGNKQHEVQQFTCTADSGYFTITFRAVESIPILYTYTNIDIMYALRRMNTVLDSVVTLSNGDIYLYIYAFMNK
jgi:hypothetical protein